MRKYVFITAQAGHQWGGSGLLWVSAAEHLVREGNEVRVSVRDWGKPVAQAKAPTVELLDEAMNRAWNDRAQLKEIGRTAATDARRFVSRDQGQDFAQELVTVASNDGKMV